MTRVEWTLLDGGAVEAVVAMFVNREQVNSVRITPSRGDGGVDILDRAAGPGGGDAVYQVKRYTEALTAKQKSEVEKSLRALERDPRWAGLNVTVWYLVTPWNPTPEAETWLHDLAGEHGFTAVWRGLDHVEQLAAKYPDVVDYYLHGGRNRIIEAHQAVAALFGVDQGGEHLDVPGVAERIRKALPTLDADPHYRYELRFGEGPPPGLASRPNLVMTWVADEVNGGHWTAVDIIARCAASVQERPITVNGQFVTEPGSDIEAAYRDFISFGTPFTSPEGAYRIEVDAPGGLGGLVERATVMTSPITEDVGDNPQLHLQVLAPNGTVLADADVDRTVRSQGQDGLRVVLEETHRVFSIEDRYNFTTETITRTMHRGDFTGQPASAVRPALEFLLHCHSPNQGRMSIRHTPPGLGTTDPTLGFKWPEETQRTVTNIFNAVDSLAVIQRHTATVIRVPDFAAIPPGQPKDWYIAAQILRGEEVTLTYPEGHCVYVTLDNGIAPPPAGEFGVTTPLAITIGEQRVDLGTTEVWLTDAMLMERRPHEGGTLYAFITPGRTVRYRRPADSPST